ncbi:hypothetical protein [Microvirga pudoricolor]|uniref:hypothetical protein n=1 Tax=Microvirga pudoricolor TaxID=2778729 RepID=UPI0019505518|nr:hypothetical protein [Microvirga pudoricolor]MBM6594656.1 hypothetical protein [Microvirga pudoricolor]
MLSIKRSVFFSAVTLGILASSQAMAIRVNERPPPNGMNGPSVSGFSEPFPADLKRDGVSVATAASVTFPDGSRVVVK